MLLLGGFLVQNFYMSCGLLGVWLGSLTVTVTVTCNPEVTWVQVRLRTGTRPSNDLRQVVHTHVPLSPSSIIWYRFHCWDANRHTA